MLSEKARAAMIRTIEKHREDKVIYKLRAKSTVLKVMDGGRTVIPIEEHVTIESLKSELLDQSLVHIRMITADNHNADCYVALEDILFLWVPGSIRTATIQKT